MTDAARVVAALTARGWTLATAESLTGGLVGAALTSVPGASRAYRGGVVAYASAVKMSVLGVPQALVTEHGVISQQCVVAMATGVQRLCGADWAIATSGVAGPASQEGQRPGTVWLGVLGPPAPLGEPRVSTHLLQLDGDRTAIRAGSVDKALALLLAAMEV